MCPDLLTSSLGINGIDVLSYLKGIYSFNKPLFRRMCTKGWVCKDGNVSLVLKEFSSNMF